MVEAFPYELFKLRAADLAISADMPLCIGALRWRQCVPCCLVHDRDRRRKSVDFMRRRPLAAQAGPGACG